MSSAAMSVCTRPTTLVNSSSTPNSASIAALTPLRTMPISKARWIVRSGIISDIRLAGGLRHIGKEYRAVFREEPLRNAEDAVGDEKCRCNVNRIVQMAEQNHRCHEYRPPEKDVPQRSLLPEDERHQERNAGVPGEEEVAARKEVGDERPPSRVGSFDGERSDVRHHHEGTAEKEKKRQAMERKRYALGVRE